jgi:uncharacterized membrane protein YfcA
VCAPILIATLGPREGVRTALVLSTFLNVALLARTHRDVLWREGSILLVPAVASTPFLAWASRRIDGRLLTILAGVLTVLSAAALLAGVRWRRARGVGAGLIAGVVSAAMNVIGSIGGPALALYSVNSDWPPTRARSTLQVVFLATNVVAIAALGLPGSRDARGWAVLIAALAVGWVAGLRLHRLVPEDGARVATLGVAALGGLIALFRAL